MGTKYEHIPQETGASFDTRYQVVKRCIPNCPACVREATLREVGEYLWQKHVQYAKPGRWYDRLVDLSLDEINAFGQGRMPAEPIREERVMECKNCLYGHWYPIAGDDAAFDCNPPDGVCPHNLIPECHWISEPDVTAEDIKRAEELAKELKCGEGEDARRNTADSDYTV